MNDSTNHAARMLRRRRLTDLSDVSMRNNGRALVRVDYNVPLAERDGSLEVVSAARIQATLPTIERLLAAGVPIVLASHLGRPRGERREEYSLRPVARRLGELLNRDVRLVDRPFADDGGPERVAGQDIVLLENLRFEPGETADDLTFARRLACYADWFVQDAFGTCHRRHASTVGVTTCLDPCVAGMLLERELKAFQRVLDPEPPFVAVLGGAKIAGKLETVRGLAERCDCVCLGGGMANTFLLAAGREIGNSLAEPDRVDEARALLDRYRDVIVLPVDAVVARELEPGAETKTVDIDRVEPGWRIFDVGPRTLDRYAVILERARTVFWNGPLGVFETPPFDAGTREIAERIARCTVLGAYTVTGGGDSVAALEQAGRIDSVSHVSTGGGAALELLSGNVLPGIEALDLMVEDRV